MRRDSEVKLKYPIKKYLLPWSLLVINAFVLIRLGNYTFMALALISTLGLYLILRLAAKQIEKKDKEIEGLKKSLSNQSGQVRTSGLG